jgi:hypothetical protein
MVSEHISFIAYCIEEYKTANNLKGNEVINLFKKYDVLKYIKICYGALHTMGGLAISEDINSLIEGAKGTH